jgi:16S rRNA (guanine527-N7)-methyltransferase
VVTGRAEVVGQIAGHREGYDWAVARSVARLPVLGEYLLPLVKVGGYALAQKGETAEQEVEDALAAIEILGGKMDRMIPVELPGIEENRYLVVIKKTAPTLEKYPRREGMPAKKPLG